MVGELGYWQVREGVRKTLAEIPPGRRVCEASDLTLSNIRPSYGCVRLIPATASEQGKPVRIHPEWTILKRLMIALIMLRSVFCMTSCYA
jgi:hypothetical protein